MKQNLIWWKIKRNLALKSFAYMILAILISMILSIYFSQAILLGLPVSYWMFIGVLPTILVVLLFRHNRQDLVHDRLSDYSGLE